MKFDIIVFCAGVSVGALLVSVLANSIFYFLGLSVSLTAGFILGSILTRLKQEREIDLLRRSLSYWRTHLGMSYRTFDPDLYDE